MLCREVSYRCTHSTDLGSVVAPCCTTVMVIPILPGLPLHAVWDVYLQQLLGVSQNTKVMNPSVGHF